MPKKLHIILWDQLSLKIPTLKNYKETDIVLMCETFEETTYVKHHKKKLVFLLSAMRHFAEELEAKKIPLEYIKLDDPENTQTLTGEVARAIKKHTPEEIVITFPGEYRLLETINSWKTKFEIPVTLLEDDRFLATREEFNTWANSRKTLRMEFFYRMMRQKYKILLKDGKPEGGQWNYDKNNRKPPKNSLNIPAHFEAPMSKITQEVITLVQKNFSDHFGDIEPFYFATTRTAALKALDKFIVERLPTFGDYQDAMIEGQPWMYHSILSFYINTGLLSPLECIQKAEKAYHSGNAPLNCTEGFIRQILGWREYVRGIYWLKMPAYKKENFLQAKRKLPEFYWGADTKMNCLKQCVKETSQNAYAHHIQRLMVLGNFALLAGLDPNEVNQWYLIVYADAFEWVELPNVTGMILFADGGYLGSKPYAASGSYINKMSNYCKNCEYSVTKKEGPNACPFNYLYWNFLIQNKGKLQNIQRLFMIYNTLSKMSDKKVAQIKEDSKKFLSSL